MGEKEELKKQLKKYGMDGTLIEMETLREIRVDVNKLTDQEVKEYLDYFDSIDAMTERLL